jgi:hypothetical protein
VLAGDDDVDKFQSILTLKKNLDIRYELHHEDCDLVKAYKIIKFQHRTDDIHTNLYAEEEMFGWYFSTDCFGFRYVLPCSFHR